MPRLKTKEERRIREMAIFNLHLRGWTNREIACALQISPSTVDYYINHV